VTVAGVPVLPLAALAPIAAPIPNVASAATVAIALPLLFCIVLSSLHRVCGYFCAHHDDECDCGQERDNVSVRHEIGFVYFYL
jgi:hypothetical protein